MKLIKGLFAAAVLVSILLLISCQALARHDQNTRRDTLALVTKELPVGASLSDMKAFLERHTARYALDDRFHHVYGGFFPQSRLDKDLFDRAVQIDLHFDEDHRFKSAEVNIYYTFL
jgi:hypothetical protein